MAPLSRAKSDAGEPDMDNDVAVRREIEAGVQRFVTLANSGDVEAFAALYTEDALIMMPGMAAVAGRHGAVVFAERIRSRQSARLVLVRSRPESCSRRHWSARGSGTRMSMRCLRRLPIVRARR